MSKKPTRENKMSKKPTRENKMSKKPTREELEGKVQFYEEAIGEARKQAMKALRESGLWNPEFHQQELAAITAIFLATINVLIKKEEALTVAVEFIGKLKGDKKLHGKCFDALTNINEITKGKQLTK